MLSALFPLLRFVRNPVTFPSSLLHPFSGSVPAPHHSSRVYTPLSRQQPNGAGLMDPHPTGDCFVPPVRVAPIPYPCGFFFHLFPDCKGCCAFPAEPPSWPRPGPHPLPVPIIHVYTSAGQKLPCGPGLRDRFLPLALVAPIRTPTGFSLCVVCFLVFFLGLFAVRTSWAAPPPHLPLCVCALSCGFLLLLFVFFTILPACTHDTAALVVCCCGYSLCSSPVLLPLWGVPLPGPRPSKVGAPPLHHPLSSPRPTPAPLLACNLSPVLLLPCPVCAALLLSAPALYLARPHASLCLRSILPPVGRLGQPPQVPLREDSLLVRPRRLPLHQFPDGGAGRLIRLDAGHWHGVHLWAMCCTCLPLFAPPCPFLRVYPCPASAPAPSPLRLLCCACRCWRTTCVFPLLPASLSLPCRPIASPPARSSHLYPPPTPCVPTLRYTEGRCLHITVC